MKGGVPKKQGSKGKRHWSIGISLNIFMSLIADHVNSVVAIGGSCRIAVVFYPISCFVNDLIQFIYDMLFECNSLSMESACSFISIRSF